MTTEATKVSVREEKGIPGMPRTWFAWVGDESAALYTVVHYTREKALRDARNWLRRHRRAAGR